MISEEKMFFKAKQLAKRHFFKFNMLIPLDDLESELMFWLSTHMQQLRDVHNKGGETLYNEYFKKCSDNILIRYSRKVMVDNLRVSSVGIVGYDEKSQSQYGFYLTPEVVEQKIKEKDPMMLKMVEDYCTELQKETIIEILVNNVVIGDLAEFRGRSKSSIYRLIERGIENIVVKNAYEDSVIRAAS